MTTARSPFSQPVAIAPELNPVPAPRGPNGMRFSCRSLMTRETWSVEREDDGQRARPVRRHRIAFVNQQFIVAPGDAVGAGDFAQLSYDLWVM